MTSELTAKPARLLSLDIFRGFTMAAMILVNDPGDWAHIYPPLEHAVWNGCTPTDLIFPSFLFMAGVSIVYAMQGKKADTANHTKMLLHAFRRMVTLIIISWLIQLFYHPSLSHLRFPGVLQRIAVVYFIATFLYLKSSQKALDWMLGISLVGYYIIMTFIPVPDGHAPNLEPETNMGAWIDRLVFTTNHLWASSKTWDPEGLLGVLPSVGTALFGMRVGTWIKRTDRDSNTKTAWLFTYGILAIVAGLIWDLFFPINKALWSSSYVLYAGGISTVGLTLAYWFIDVQGHKKLFWPFLVFGANSISAYILADIVPGLINFIKVNHNGKKMGGMDYLYQTLFAPHFSPVNASVIDALVFVLLIWVMMYPLYIKKIIIKV
ncbi:acyltransferase family protein [Mucilaginibacter polytrichastri]|uniref:Heparan-alpha-glucosaminide N-acetyltransferase catalytic domain-containing protein n=1 Tax=Mucilaginibacter polytrichastri TaxID=1302689 RepID=A0A1Q6A3K7_9SPHI|nr:DUF5009 domain-containing protein [Mucilaginibacter polytrichastri]OKS88587.1 hypothetical protein RG47T_4058 [Mucilaginibacter polytrichastri]SFT11326.1 Predicted acyltransferase [Mucilaginibacter polytrichastri]